LLKEILTRSLFGLYMLNVFFSLSCYVLMLQYGDGEGNAIEENFDIILPNPNELVAVSKVLWAVKLCSNKILQCSTGKSNNTNQA